MDSLEDVYDFAETNTSHLKMDAWKMNRLASVQAVSGRLYSLYSAMGFFLKALGLRTGALISLMWRQGLYPIGGENPWFNSPPAWRNIPIIESYPRRSLTGYALMPTISHLEWQHFFQTYENLGPSRNSPALKIAGLSEEEAVKAHDMAEKAVRCVFEKPLDSDGKENWKIPICVLYLVERKFFLSL